MAKVLSKTGVQSGQTIQAFHVSQSVDAFTGQSAYDITVSGSLNVNGYSLPTVDGNENQVMVTNGAGVVTFQNLPLANTASFVTSSGVWGPYGSNSIQTASFAVSASHVEFADVASASYHAINASDANTATTASYARTASVVTDPNVVLLDQSNTFTGQTQTFTNDIVVNGTASFTYFQSVTGSAKIIGDAYIVLNNNTPAERYAGIAVQDSGSTNNTASLEFDGQTNDWFYQYTDDGGATVDHGVILFGAAYNTKGSPTYPTNNTIQKGTGEHHLVDSSIVDNGTTVSTSLPFTATQITASTGFKGDLVGNVTGTSTTASYVEYTNIANKPTLVSSSAQIASDISGAFSESSASFSTRITNLEEFSSSLDANFATDAEVNAATASLSSSLAVDIATNASNISDLQSFSSSLDDTFVTESELNIATASLSSSLATDIAENKSNIDTLEAKTLFSGSSQVTLQSTTGNLSGSRIIGSVPNATSASYSLTASYALSSQPQVSASYATSASHALTSNSSISSSYALTASYALNAQSATVDTGSLIVTASATDNTITFTKGDSSTFNITIDTGSAQSASFASSASHAEFADNSRDSVSSSFALTASYFAGTVISSSYAISSSHAEFADSSRISVSSSHATSGEGNFNGNFSGSFVATGDILPSANETHNLGSPTKRFQELYLSGSSIFLGDSKITIVNNQLKVVDSASGEDLPANFSGSFTGSFLGSLDGLSTSASFATTASYVLGTVSSASFSISSSHSEFADSSTDSVSSSFALTASYALNAGGGGITETLEYNGQIRYEIISGSSKAQIVSSGNVYKNLSWSRSTTTLTVNSTSHGLSDGDNVLIRNMSEDYELKKVTTSGSNAFTCTVADSGGTSGTLGAYIPAFDCSTIDLTTGTVTVTAPSAGDLQLGSMMVYAPSSESDPITINIPAGDSNSGGINSALDTRFPPLCTFYKLDGANPVLTSTATINYSKTSNFAQYTIGGGSPDTFGPVQFILRF